MNLSSDPDIVIATHNPTKAAEIRSLLLRSCVKSVSALDLGLREPAEVGSNYEDNARLKAEAAARQSALPAIGDDSGVEIDLLPGELGIHTARWIGAHGGHTNARALLKKLMDGYPPEERSDEGCMRDRRPFPQSR
jgi:XTP/dITP diphosphohydrolase